MNATTDTASTAARTGWREWMSWIRPWYVGAVLAGGHLEGHIYPDCERLLRVVSEPQEGSGWLDPADPRTCGTCQERHAAGEEPQR